MSPKPVSKVSLSVEEQIPKEFYQRAEFAGKENTWIKYYISIDDGTTWRRIAPIHHRDTIADDGVNRVSEIININSDVATADRKNPLAYIDTVSPVYSIRFKAVLSRPTTISNADSYTPVLSRYVLQIYPLGGL